MADGVSSVSNPSQSADACVLRVEEMSDVEVVIESHLVELEAMGFTIVNDVRIVQASVAFDDKRIVDLVALPLPLTQLGCVVRELEQAIPPELLQRLKANHAQIVKRVRETKFAPTTEGVSQGLRHSWESPMLGVVDAFRLYAMDDAYEELLTLPKVFPIIDRAIREGRGRPGHPGGPRLYHEMMQHHPAGTEGGQGWHRYVIRLLQTREPERSCDTCVAWM
jgi:hypothetical protein